MDSRKLVIDTMEFKNTDRRVPRDVWILPAAKLKYKTEIDSLTEKYPLDIKELPLNFKEKTIAKGNPYEIGESIDAWGCKFSNIKFGIIGEVKEPLVKDENWEDSDNIHIPEEWLSFDIDETNNEIKKFNNKFIFAGTPRPFEQLQFIRGSENLYMDLMIKPKKMFEFIEKMHDFYCRYITKIAKTNCDGISFMDDWGSQRSLLINPLLWRELFRPMYRDFIDIAKKHGKKALMHSDGYIVDIIPDLIDIGLDAVNSQIFCMGVDKLKQFKGKITFWGEIDRQNLLPFGSVNDIRSAVQSVYDNLYCNGGCIAQCEVGPDSKMENVEEVYSAWNSLHP